MKIIAKIKSLLFENKDVRQTIAKNVFWLTISQLGSRLIRASIIIYAARILGAAEYGVFSYALGFAGFFTVFADIGVGQIMTRETAKRPAERSYYFATTFWIKLTLLLITAFLIIFIAPYISKIEAVKPLLPFVALLVIFDGLREFSLSFFRALEKMEWEAIITVVTNVMISISGFVILYFFASARVLTMTYALSVGFGATVAILIIKDEFKNILTHAKGDLVKRIVSSAIPIAFSSALGAFMLNTDFVMLGWWQTAEAIGYYSSGQKIVQLLYTFPAIIASAIFPTFARLIGEGDNQKIRMLMEKSVTMAFAMALPIVVGGIVLSRPIIGFVYGQGYIPAVLNFQILMLTVLITFPGVLFGNAVIANDRQAQKTKYLFAAAISNAVLDALLIPPYGIVGSSIATIIALSIDVSLSWRLLKKINNFSILPYVKKITFSVILMGAFSFVLNNLGLNVVINIIVSAGIYLGLLYILREKILGEMKFILRTIRS